MQGFYAQFFCTFKIKENLKCGRIKKETYFFVFEGKPNVDKCVKDIVIKKFGSEIRAENTFLGRNGGLGMVCDLATLGNERH